MKNSVILPALLTLGLLATAYSPRTAGADSINGRCDIYPAGEDHASLTLPCTFSQYQGNVYIDRSDGVSYTLLATGDRPGNFKDQKGRAVYRQSGLGKDGVIFRLPGESLYIYWDSSSLSVLKPADSSTAPYTTSSYNATTLLPCSMTSPAHELDCPAGIIRNGRGSATLHLMNPEGKERLITFDNGRVTTPDNRKVTWTTGEGDYSITVDDREYYFVPEGFIYGD
jgi:hypothetical protein